MNFASETRYSYAAIKGFHMAIMQSYAEALGCILLYDASLQWVSLFPHYVLEGWGIEMHINNF